MSGDTGRPGLAALALGLRNVGEGAIAERDTERAARLAGAAAVLPLAVIAEESAAQDLGGENRLIQQARRERPPAAGPRPGALTALRLARLTLAAALIAAFVVFAWLALQPDDPISGRAQSFTDDDRAGVLIPQYRDRAFALVFWGLDEPVGDDTWQLWLVRESGAVEAGPFFHPDDEGRAAVAVNPNRLESDDPLIGFVVSLDDPWQRPPGFGTPDREDIRYQFTVD